MSVYHSRRCPYSSDYDVCTCGSLEDAEELERLRGIVESLRRLAENAEEISLGETASLCPMSSHMVHASDIIDVLEGRMS